MDRTLCALLSDHRHHNSVRTRPLMAHLRALDSSAIEASPSLFFPRLNSLIPLFLASIPPRALALADVSSLWDRNSCLKYGHDSEARQMRAPPQ
jgi:hypothetical protein